MGETMTFKELKNKIPQGWNEVNLETYQRVISQTYDWELQEHEDGYELQQIDNSLLTIAAITGVDINIIRGYDIKQYIDLVTLIQWASKLPEPLKDRPSYLIDTLDLTVNNYLTYKALGGEFKSIDNVASVVEFFIRKEPISKWKRILYFWKDLTIKPIDVNKMNMIEIVTLFFFAQKTLTKYLERLRIKQTVQLKTALMMQKLQASQKTSVNI
ncbi:hypothetical protein [Pedobacter sp. MR2016-24]|uniref:hypothetical protein n=1 Tax=Pedobacter sp. MR2016-24 TaxID=2994466 RepID=UPI002248620B|nr:hypothetical protein [Pedobacter sp. MR2016-24]MCX2486597.1 hypothetical protein [Pedobacter sp. MR2016-24]